MANEERKPLLIRVNSSWNRRANGGDASIQQNDSNVNSTIENQNSDEIRQAIGSLNVDTSNSPRTRIALGLILLVVVLERMVFYGFTENLIIFLSMRPFKWQVLHILGLSFVFYSMCHTMSFIGGWISDSFLGRFKTLMLGLCIYIVGAILMPFIAVNSDRQDNNSLPSICQKFEYSNSDQHWYNEQCYGLMLIILSCLAISSGIMRAVIVPFGSDQIIRASQPVQLSFFNWFYWCINLGSFLGMGILAYVEQVHSFLYGYIACAMAIGCAAILFISAAPVFDIRPPDGSVLTNILKIIRDAWRNKWQSRRLHRSLKTKRTDTENEDDESQPERNIPFLDYAKHRYGGSFHNTLVEDVKKLGMILLVFAVLIPYWLIYFQIHTTFVLQGLNMRLFFDFHKNKTTENKTKPLKSEIAVVWLNLCDAFFVIILLPLFDRVIYPRMARAGYHFTFAKRIVVGLIFAAAAVAVAGVVEQYRWRAMDPDFNNSCFKTYTEQKIGTKVYNASSMSVIWQIPQYALVGLSEVFASVACLQFAVMVAPNSMKAAITGLFYFFTGVGAFLGLALIALLGSINKWVPAFSHQSNINCWLPCDTTDLHAHGTHPCHFDYYFFLLAGIVGLGLILFLMVARCHDLNIDELTFLSQPQSSGAERRQVSARESTSRTQC